MAFWGTDTLNTRLPDLIREFNPKRVISSAYELGMGPEAYVTDEERKTQLHVDDQLVIRPGQFAQLLTEEEVRVPLDAIAFISLKTGFKSQGLINVSGFHVDPGFHGKLIFSVLNAGAKNVVLSRKAPVFSIWYASLDIPQKIPYHGEHNNQKHISDKSIMALQGDLPSGAVLLQNIKTLEHAFEMLAIRVNHWVVIASALSIGLLLAILSFAFTIVYDLHKPASNGNHRSTAVNLTPTPSPSPASSPHPPIIHQDP